jgi:hypothetical protein
MTQQLPPSSTMLNNESSDAATCPMSTAQAQRAAECPLQCTSQELQPEDELIFPKHKRVVTLYEKGESGQLELHLHYRAIEIVFDEPELFAFAETLVKQARFVAASAQGWGPGYAWPRVQELLEQLLQSGVLRRAALEPAAIPVLQGLVASALPSAESSEPRTWWECEAITRELTGTALPLGFLELVVPLHRVAHSALDSEGRQVGEANVFPPALRLDVPTEWRVCQYPGSRFQDEFPMNVSALKSMVRHWQPMLIVLARVRAEYLLRFGRARAGWTVGDIHRIACLSMGIAGYLLLRNERTASSAQLHPVFSSLVRICDGVRMTATELLFSPSEGVPLAPETPLSASELYTTAERNDLMLSTYGVCAAPKQMIEEFLDALFDGLDQTEPAALDPEIRTALASIGSQACVALRERLRADYATLLENDLGSSEARAKQLRAYGELYASCADALRESPAAPELFAPETNGDATDVEFRAALGHHLTTRLATSDAITADLVDAISELVQHEQRLVRAASVAQANVNRVLGRPTPPRLLAAADLAFGHRLRHPGSRLPYVMDAIDAALGIRIRVTSHDIELRA